MERYRAGGVPYYIDGGAGGALYINDKEPIGTDGGYWYGFRLVRVSGKRVQSDAVPVIVPGGITVSGPRRLIMRRAGAFSATARQPATEGVKVTALPLRDPDPARPNAANLPAPVRIWTAESGLILHPLAQKGDDPRRDIFTQTASGRYAARCPGKTRLTVTSGFQSRATSVTVPSRSGAILRSLRGAASTLPAGRSTTIAEVLLAQRARVFTSIVRDGRVLARPVSICGEPGRTIALRWNGRLKGGRKAAAGRYLMRVTVASDRAPIHRAYALSVR